MKTTFEISDQVKMAVTDFNENIDLSIHLRQPNGNLVTTGAVVLTNDQAIVLAVHLINRSQKALQILKPKYLSEDNNEQRKAMITSIQKNTVKKTLMESLLSPNTGG
ncbi:MAG: hypothetical protein PHG30_04890 [Eubacteriales bacterium]|nr:hypothetical protein [Eubacteriales bacterium]MDD4734762.1 hypothetical protein [Kiritimatiellia bacterium]